MIPTTGSEGSVIRLLKSVVNEAPVELLISTEVIVYLNKHPAVEVDEESIRNYVESLTKTFHSARFELSKNLHLTAEASACSAVSFATGEFLWIAGDKRIFLPAGLHQLTKYLDAPTTPCAYFNSVRQERNGYTNVHASTHLSKSVTTIKYKRLVQKIGINFMPTNMGVWIFKRKCLDLAIWNEVRETCGPHFSHVTTLLATMGDEDVTCYSVFLAIMELKPYHGGDAGEWVRYAEMAKSYRFFPWTFGMVRQFQFLINRDAYTYLDVRRSMCTEASHLGRQIDEIYVHFYEQIKLGWNDHAERLTQAEFDEIHGFLVRTAPERTVINGLLEKLYKRTRTEIAKNTNRPSRPVLQAIALDHDGVKFGSLIVGQVGDQYIRLHPDGYLVSPVTDNSAFLLAYKLVDAPKVHKKWRIIQDFELYDLHLEIAVNDARALLPAFVNRDLISSGVKKERRIKRLARKIFGPIVKLIRTPSRLFKRVSRAKHRT